MKNKPNYDQLRHELDSKMLQASNLTTQIEQQGFVNRSFMEIHKAHKQKQVNDDEYVKLVNRLAAYKSGAFNDYLDILAGAAQFDLLELVIQGEMSKFFPEQARQRRQQITYETGIEPVDPEEDEK